MNEWRIALKHIITTKMYFLICQVTILVNYLGLVQYWIKKCGSRAINHTNNIYTLHHICLCAVQKIRRQRKRLFIVWMQECIKKYWSVKSEKKNSIIFRYIYNENHLFNEFYLNKMGQIKTVSPICFVDKRKSDYY